MKEKCIFCGKKFEPETREQYCSDRCWAAANGVAYPFKGRVDRDRQRRNKRRRDT